MSNVAWDQTWRRLQQWTDSSTQAERLAHQILLADGYTRLDPSAPLGGPDGGKDAICERDSKRWAVAVYFARSPATFSALRRKFLHDLESARSNGVHGVAFVTNERISPAERDRLADDAVLVDLYHLERITTILDQPSMRHVREQFLGTERPVRGAPRTDTSLVALGPKVLARGRVHAAEGARWRATIAEPFLLGAEADLLRLADGFPNIADSERYVCVESMGEGRVLSSPIRWTYEEGGWQLELDVLPLAARSSALELHEDTSIRMEPPFGVEIGRTVAGLERVPQRISTLLSINKGGWGIASEVGSRVAFLHDQFGRDQLASFVAIEVARLAATPIWDEFHQRAEVPFDIVEAYSRWRCFPIRHRAGRGRSFAYFSMVSQSHGRAS